MWAHAAIPCIQGKENASQPQQGSELSCNGTQNFAVLIINATKDKLTYGNTARILGMRLECI